MRKITYGILIGLMLLILGCTTGCITAIQSNKIIAVKQRFFGFAVAQNPATQMYQVYLGWGSFVYQMIPTSTNPTTGEIYSPNYMDTYDLGASANPFGTTISEDTGTGNVVLDNETHVVIPYRLGSRFQKK